jgi:hypothetical protein
LFRRKYSQEALAIGGVVLISVAEQRPEQRSRPAGLECRFRPYGWRRRRPATIPCYAGGNLNPEPYAYEEGFSMRWLMIGDQIAGKPELNCDPAKGPMRSGALLLFLSINTEVVAAALEVDRVNGLDLAPKPLNRLISIYSCLHPI